jgi:serine/threonine protein kinase
MTEDCPDDSELWPLAAGEAVDEELTAHVNLCERCSRQVQALQTEFESIRGAGSFCEGRTTEATLLLDKIGDYKILSFLAYGGQADVYRAWHPRLKIDVVVKWYRTHVTESARNEWIAAATTLCAVNHPHLGRLFDIGVEQGRPYQVIKFVRGNTFGDWIRKYQPSLLRIMTVLAQVARAVDAVHQFGALHLDLKPENILIDELGHPRVINFGMAPVSNGRSVLLTMSPGTPEYMSPEQCAGDAERIGIASDVYGLGAVLYFALTGQSPRSEKRMTLEPNWKLLRGSPSQLIRVCSKAMATDAAFRHQTAADFAQELDRYIELHHWTGRSLSTLVTVLGCLGLLLGIAMTPSRPAVTFSVKSQSHLGTREGSDYSVQLESRTPYPPQWQVTTSRTGPTRITEKWTTQVPESTYEPQWVSQIDLDFLASGGPYLVVAGDPNGPMIDCSAIVQKLDIAPSSWATVQITRSGIQWNGLLEKLSESERDRLVRATEQIRQKFAARQTEYLATLIFPAAAARAHDNPAHTENP